MSEKPFVPYIPSETTVPEFTAKAIILGLILAVVMAAANTYLGLYAGMTVSASIPSAVMSMGILRGVLRRGTILENNIVQTIASSGEAVAAGIIFTVPALVITQVWTKFEFWPVTCIAIIGGILGVLFMIPLRRVLIVEEKELAYPEGVACAEVLKVGETGGSGMAIVFGSMIVGILFQGFKKGLSLFQETLETAVKAGKSIWYGGSDVSVALIAVGYIVGLDISVLIFAGGVLGWLIGIPIIAYIYGIPDGNALDAAWGIWTSKIRYVGVGAMIVGGVSSIIKVRSGIAKSLSGAFAALKKQSGSDSEKRTEINIPMKHILPIMGLLILATIGLYTSLTNSFIIGFVAALIMVIAAFFFVAVSSYIVGLVGSSNNPVSGMTICTLLFTALVLLIFGFKGTAGILATLGVAGVVCCAACMAGDTSQDLKTGYLVGATPKSQQWGLVLGVVVPAFTIAPVLTVLHGAYGIGVQVKEGVPFLKAPQAMLFASITKGLFGGGGLPWAMVYIGAGIGIALLILDEFLKRKGSRIRAYVMPVAVGIYLPLSLSVPILLGGILSAAVLRVASKKGALFAEEANHRGVLFSSGLIAGEAIMGIVLAILIFAGIKLPIKLLQSNMAVNLLTFLVIVAVIIALYKVALAKYSKQN